MKYRLFAAFLIAAFLFPSLTSPSYAATDDPYELMGSNPTYSEKATVSSIKG